ncbi:sensor histidine kinase [Caldalkalibacillus mannanilyticus]|uniref:sensor histidine kinase n=1 Tax=Caldalkalibacillus mannanilyticus TaxID=1418 RepID=UPI000469311B|nr:HAMP domain-containing sensor histidine kinase [Caldalkalibacillus mannanilyticus]
MTFFRSLLAKYMLIIFVALFLIQMTTLFIAIFITSLDQKIEPGNKDTQQIEQRWHQEARAMHNPSVEGVLQHFAKWKEQYPDSTMFWVGETGALEGQLGAKDPLPSYWSVTDTARFMKERYGGDPYTVLAFVGEEQNEGFVVFEIPRAVFTPPMIKVYEQYGTILIIGVVAIIFLFITLSFLFFRSIRKRLLQLQEAMEMRDLDGLPIQISVSKKDEIGQLEETFNHMVDELRESKKREQKEEQLRRELIANLSHDLRTPLTKIRAQAYSIGKEPLSLEGKQAIENMEVSIANTDRLIENLMSYTLLVASKYAFEPREMNMGRFLREQLASWYPVFEKEEFEIHIALDSFANITWEIDPIWMGRVVDNLFQNVLRHAKSGKYIEVRTESTPSYDVVVISDRGKGMENKSVEKGAGIGLSIVDMMLRGMRLDWEIHSTEQGTVVQIKRYK